MNDNDKVKEAEEAAKKWIVGRYEFSPELDRNTFMLCYRQGYKAHAAKHAAEVERWKEAVDKLQAFKDFVHRRLDQAGIPTHPDGEHSKAGCRIGDRLDMVADIIATQHP